MKSLQFMTYLKNNTPFSEQTNMKYSPAQNNQMTKMIYSF